MGNPLVELPSSDYTRAALDRAALRAELSLSLVRALFCVLVAARFMTVELLGGMPGGAERAAVMLPPTLLAFGFSVLLLVRLRRGRGSRTLLTASVIADSVVCTVALTSNVLWPFPGYRGFAFLPENATFLALIFAAGFRVSSRLALVGAVANGLGFAALLGIDRLLHPELPDPGANVLSLFLVLFGCASGLSFFGARRTERLVHDAAHHSYKTERAEQGLSSLLEGHHDAMSLLSAALFGVERLKQGAVEQVEDLAQDLEMLRLAVSRIKEEALREVLVLRPPVQVCLRTALDQPRATFGRLAAPAEVTWELDERAEAVMVAGGRLALQRLVMNLLVNAKQGDGTRGATQVRVALERRSGEVALHVEDDGPGFPRSLAGTAEAIAQSSKPEGTASGLRFVRAVVAASGGRVRTENTGSGGRVTVVLPAVPQGG